MVPISLCLTFSLPLSLGHDMQMAVTVTLPKAVNGTVAEPRDGGGHLKTVIMESPATHYAKFKGLSSEQLLVQRDQRRDPTLLDSCLKSPLLPAYLAASFAKKLSRLLLSVPPSGALVITALIHNILRRHPSINCLVHREDSIDEGKGDHKTDEVIATDLDNAKTGAVPCRKSGFDHFNIEETNPMKSGAMRCSLWEIDTILHRYCPPVSRFALSLGNDLTSQGQNK